MLDLLFSTVLRPMSRRIGTFVAGYLASVGVEGELSSAIAAGAAALATVGIDLLLSNRAGKGG